MTFCQSTHAPPQRQLTLSVPASPSSAQTRGRTRRLSEESQEWILFSPSLAEPARTHTTCTGLTPRTAGLSTLSDYGSLDTAAGSQSHEDIDDKELDIDDTDEGEEFDSLDSHLHAFREPSVHPITSQQLAQNGEAVLPTHDGTGTFGESTTPFQEHLWRLEQYQVSGSSTRHRRLSVQRRLEEADRGETEASQRIQRIEDWRMEQSQILLDEIDNESRRRRMSRLSGRNKAIMALDEGQIVKKTSDGAQMESKSLSMEEDREAVHNEVAEETESFWRRITRRMIRKLIGINEPLLSIICGHYLPSATTSSSGPLLGELRSDSDPSGDDLAAVHSSFTWESRLFDRIARELGTLVHQLSEHPGAFSTFLLAQQVNDYAGFPPIPPNVAPSLLTPLLPNTANPKSTTESQFRPTIQNDASTQAALWGIEEQAGFPNAEEVLADCHEAECLNREREYWEKELDVQMVFGFLRNRFVSSSRSNTPISTATRSTQDAATRAAFIRHHHPLVSRRHDQRLHLQSTTGHLLHFQHRSSSLGSVKRPGSSCASQRTKRRSSGSSRNYWDLGGSAGSVSAIGASAGIGVWGEV
ncbi:MAG: hypothetical protein M1835_001893 [Candelina submexicana]|nr:MAG: hypothetical protein M1835_001893 [Candelina submexicana]